MGIIITTITVLRIIRTIMRMTTRIGTIMPITIMATNMSGKKNMPLVKGRGSRKRSSLTLPPRSGGEGRRERSERRGGGTSAVPAAPDPSPPLASLAAGGENKALYRLMAWLSPSYPVGAFSYSSGIEWAVESGDIKDAATLTDWLAAMMTAGGGFCDAVFLAHAHRAATAENDVDLRATAELAAAFAPSKERHLETTAQGRAFVEATRAAWPCAALDLLAASWDGPVAYPVAVGVAAAGHGIAADATLHAFLHAVGANWISAGVRLIPLGQTDGQRALAMLEPVIADTARRALKASLDDLGSATFRADLASMRHETQYTRLFRS
jgi:urease accessory protein